MKENIKDNTTLDNKQIENINKTKLKDKYRIYLLPVGNRIKLIGSAFLGMVLFYYLSSLNVLSGLITIFMIVTALYFCYTVYISFNYYIYLDFNKKVLIIKDFLKNTKDIYDLSILNLKEIKFSNGYGNFKKTNYAMVFVFETFEVKVENWSFQKKNVFIGKVDYYEQRNRLSIFTMKTNLRLIEYNYKNNINNLNV